MTSIIDDLNVTELRVLELLQQNPDAVFSANNLVQELDKTRHSMRRAARRLVRLGLARVTPCFSDEGTVHGSGYTLVTR